MLPLIYLGAGVAGVYASLKLSEIKQKDSGHVRFFPGESKRVAMPKNGSIVCCGIYGILEHTGIWVDGHIIELSGNGLVRALSPDRFLQQRSGEHIYLACDASGNPLASELIAQRAVNRVYEYSDYHLLNNNCHKFVVSCVSPRSTHVMRFSDVNQYLYEFFGTSLHWLLLNK